MNNNLLKERDEVVENFEKKITELLWVAAKTAVIMVIIALVLRMASINVEHNGSVRMHNNVDIGYLYGSFEVDSSNR